MVTPIVAANLERPSRYTRTSRILKNINIMAYTSPAVVIDNGSYTTKAGFASDDLPSLVFSSVYASDESDPKKVIIGDDEIAQHPTKDVMTLLQNGLIYNFDHIVDNWNYVYDNIDNRNSISSKEYPLVLTEPVWNTPKNKIATAQIAFETLEVPIFALVKTPLAQLYHMNKSSGLVIDIGASTASVTPILDGIIQTKSTFHNKYAGDFANAHILNYFQGKLGDDYLTKLLPRSYLSDYESISDSFKRYYVTHNSLHDFKSSMLSVKPIPPIIEAQLRQQQQYHPVDPEPAQPANYQLVNDSYVTVSPEEKTRLLEPIFDPFPYKLADVQLPEPAIDKPATNGLSHLILLSLKHLETSVASQFNNGSANAMNNIYGKFNDTLRDLFSNIVITGGGSLGTGVSERILEDLRRNSQSYFNNYSFAQAYKFYQGALRNYGPGDINNVWDRQFGAWIGAANLASMLNDGQANDDEGSGVNIALDNWFVTKAEYEELGEDHILEKFK